MLTEKNGLFYFDSTYKLYEAYKNINTENPTEGFQMGYTIEGLGIIRELDYLYKKITSLNDYFVEKNDILPLQLQIWKKHCENNNIDFSEYLAEKLHEILEIINVKRSDKAYFKAKLHSELFYYKAFRLRTIIRYSGGLGTKFECQGLNKIRNILIEHPEKLGLMYSYSFELGRKKNGPILKTWNPEHGGKFKDTGLFNNTLEFKTNLEKILADFNSKHD